MNKRLATALNAFLIAVMFAIALWTIDQLPAGVRIATHWGPDGQPDAWMGKWAGLLVNPIISCVVWFLLSAFPQNASLPGKLVLPDHARRALFSCVLLVQIAAEILIASNALGRAVDPGTYISIALGILYIVVGAGLRQLQWNFVWIRSSIFTVEVWETSHKVGRWIFVLSGIGIIIVALSLRQRDMVVGVFVLTLGAPLLTLVYSYLVSRRQEK